MMRSSASVHCSYAAEMRFAVVGAGAIGSLLAGRLALGGHDVAMLARGPQLAAIREQGLRVAGEDGSKAVVTSLRLSDRLDDLGRHDVVILGLKAHQIAPMADRLAVLYDDDTVVLTVQNGVPWWFFQGFGGPHDGHRLRSLDPDGQLQTHIPASRIVGCIAYPAVIRPEPGVVRVIEGDRFPVGELTGERTDRAKALAAALSESGFTSRVLADIRSHLWVKAWGNLAFNPISALTGASMAGIARHQETRELVASMMRESAAIAEALGLRLRISIEQRIKGAEAVGEHKTSMLQDLEAGNELELEPLVGAFRELGELTGVATPAIDAVYACTKLLAETSLTPG